MRYHPDVESALGRFVIAFLIGALIGIEREKANHEDSKHPATGLRTFILIALAGAIAAFLSVETSEPWAFAAGAVVCGVFILAGYRSQLHARPESVGLTTEFAALVTYLLGGVTLFGYPQLAVALAIATSAVLAYREVLHGAVNRIGWDDIYAGLKLLVVAFIVLPVVPREPVDPWGVLNPYDMTWLVILIASLSMLGYVITRWLGSTRGTAITGVAGGMASSTATTLSLSRRSRERAPEGAAATLAGGILFSWMVMFIRIVVICWVVNADLARELALPMGIMALVSCAGAVINHRAGVKLPSDPRLLELKNPFSLSFAIKFALLFTLVALLVNRAQAMVSPGAVYAVAGLAGLTDVDAITLSMARNSGALSTAAGAITVAALANTLVKMGLVWWVGKSTLGQRVLSTTVVLVLAAAAFLLTVL
jgi:uncharacterized membrane protein (DUF4010 family)